MFLSQTNGPALYYYGFDPTKSIEHLSKAGFRYCDISFFTVFKTCPIYFSDDYMKVVEEYKEALKRYNVTPIQSHEPAGNSIGDDNGEYYMKKTPRSIEMAAKIGCRSITIHPGTANKYALTREEFVEKNISVIRKLVPYAEEYGIELLLENIGFRDASQFTGFYTTTAQDLIDIVDEVNHPLVAVNWDVGHAHCNGLDEYAEMTKLGHLLHGIHVHDNLGFQNLDNKGTTLEGDMHTLPLFCSLDYDAVVRALIDTGYKGTFNFEVDAPQKLLRFTEKREDLSERAQAIRLSVDKLVYELGCLILQKYNILEE